jgi:hypothetical protein
MSNLSQGKILHFERIFLFEANKIPKIFKYGIRVVVCFIRLCLLMPALLKKFHECSLKVNGSPIHVVDVATVQHYYSSQGASHIPATISPCQSTERFLAS